MTTWFPTGIPVLLGDDLIRARSLKRAECRFSIHEAVEIFRDQCGEYVPIVEAAWTGEIEFAFEGERRVRRYVNALDQLPKETAALRHIEITGLELNRWLTVQHPWVEYRFPERSATPTSVRVVALDDEAWKTQARERAAAIIKRQREKDLYPSQIHIADEIAREFRTAGIPGAEGKPLTGSTIKRHALKGISSAQGKQLSTKTGQGK